jgi:hypothetical protein
MATTRIRRRSLASGGATPPPPLAYRTASTPPAAAAALMILLAVGGGALHVGAASAASSRAGADPRRGDTGPGDGAGQEEPAQPGDDAGGLLRRAPGPRQVADSRRSKRLVSETSSSDSSR